MFEYITPICSNNCQSSDSTFFVETNGNEIFLKMQKIFKRILNWHIFGPLQTFPCLKFFSSQDQITCPIQIRQNSMTQGGRILRLCRVTPLPCKCIIFASLLLFCRLYKSRTCSTLKKLLSSVDIKYSVVLKGLLCLLAENFQHNEKEAKSRQIGQ